MATTILFVLFVTLLLRATLSFPVSQDVKSVQLSDNVESVEPKVTERIFASDPDTFLIHSEDTDPVKSLNSVTFDRTFDANNVKRTKRELINGNHSCAEGMVWYWTKCVTREMYEQLQEGDDYEQEN